MNSRAPTIALIEWNWMGHHPTYFAHFAAALAEAGADVVPLCADPADFVARLPDALEGDSRLSARIAASEKVDGPIRSEFRPARLRGHYEAWRLFGGLGAQMRAWEKRNGRKIDLAFFACIYDQEFKFFRFAERFFRFPWAGLYVHARSFRMPGSVIPYAGGLPCPEKIFQSPMLRSVGVLDEGVVEPLRKLAGGKKVYVFPDFTYEGLPPKGIESGLAAKIRQFAAGRPVISLTGHLQWTKGLSLITEAACRPEMKNVFFFFGGGINWWEISESDKRALETIWERAPNMFVHSQYLPEPTMNAVIAASDVVAAAYLSFPHSSNVLTKAAVFERPIVVSDGYLMAERVQNYGLGEVIPEGDVDALVSALQRMLQPGYYEKLRERARWKDYRETHSVARLRKVFKELVKDL